MVKSGKEQRVSRSFRWFGVLLLGVASVTLWLLQNAGQIKNDTKSATHAPMQSAEPVPMQIGVPKVAGALDALATPAPAANPAHGSLADQLATLTGGDTSQVSELSKAERMAQIELLEKHLEETHAIERLNQSIATPEERKLYGAIFEKISALKQQNIQEEFHAIESRFARVRAAIDAKQRNLNKADNTDSREEELE